MDKKAEIYAAIPHREPFLFVDEVLEYEPNRIKTKKTFTDNDFFFSGHYPDFPIVPGVIVCEAVMQTGAILLSKMFAEQTPGQGINESLTKRVPVVAKMGEVRFRQMLKPGDSIIMEVEFTQKMGAAYFMNGKVLYEGKPIQRLEFTCVLAEK
ncbi:MAG: 3-hydroxyacyl-ACP dehydratase FabZ family protein [Thermoguttaceae bacterium]